MGFTSYDPRSLIRGIIGTSKAMNPDSWEEQYVLPVSHNGITYNIPIYLGEESMSKDLPAFPLIDMNLLRVDYEPHDVGARTRKHEAYIDIGIFYSQSDEIDSTTFGKAILDTLVDAIRSNQETCSFGPSSFVSIRSVRALRNDNANQVVYQYNVELYCLYYDLPAGDI
jgi:hypothetical protein